MVGAWLRACTTRKHSVFESNPKPNYQYSKMGCSLPTLVFIKMFPIMKNVRKNTTRSAKNLSQLVLLLHMGHDCTLNLNFKIKIHKFYYLTHAGLYFNSVFNRRIHTSSRSSSASCSAAPASRGTTRRSCRSCSRCRRSRGLPTKELRRRRSDCIFHTSARSSAPYSCGR